MLEFLKNPFNKPEEKNCVVKQHYITISGLATQLEAYRMADNIQKAFGLLPGMITIREASLLIPQAEYEKHLEGTHEARQEKP